MSSSLKANAPIFKWLGETVHEETVRKEPVREEPVREEPVREEEIAVGVSTPPENSFLALSCSCCSDKFYLPYPMDTDPNTDPSVMFFMEIVKHNVICNQCSCVLATEQDSDEYIKKQQDKLEQTDSRTDQEAFGHDDFVIALGGQVTDSDVEDSDVEDGCQSSASNQDVFQAVSSTATSPTPKTQQKICEHFATRAGCKFGDNCHNLHIATPGDVPVVRQPMPKRTPVVPQSSANSAGHYRGKPKPPQLCVYYFTKASGCTNPGCTRSHAYRAPEGACWFGPDCLEGHNCQKFCPGHSW